MSYEIYTSIKYNKETRCFDCNSYSNNVWPHTPNKWTMDYYAKEYPDATERELKALLILGSLYNGDKYYAAWAQEYQRIANLWADKNETKLNYETIRDIDSARSLADFYDMYIAQPKNKYVLKNYMGYYITQVNQRSYRYGPELSDAKTFKTRTSDEIKYIPNTRWLVQDAGWEPTEIKE